jgi:Fe-S cluster assembly iron-binding protein IscA
MPIDVTDEALEVVRRSLQLAGSASELRGARVRATTGLGGGLEFQVELADGPRPGDEVIERAGVTLYIDPGVSKAMPDAVIAVEPQHETIVVRPPTGSSGDRDDGS